MKNLVHFQIFSKLFFIIVAILITANESFAQSNHGASSSGSLQSSEGEYEEPASSESSEALTQAQNASQLESDMRAIDGELTVRRKELRRLRNIVDEIFETQLATPMSVFNRAKKVANHQKAVAEYMKAVVNFQKWSDQQNVSDSTKQTLSNEATLLVESFHNSLRLDYKSVKDMDLSMIGNMGIMRDAAMTALGVIGTAKASGAPLKGASIGVTAASVANVAQVHAQAATYADSRRRAGIEGEQYADYLIQAGENYRSEEIPFQPQVIGGVGGAVLTGASLSAKAIAASVTGALAVDGVTKQLISAEDYRRAAENEKKLAAEFKKNGRGIEALEASEAAIEYEAQAAALDAGATVATVDTLLGVVNSN